MTVKQHKFPKGTSKCRVYPWEEWLKKRRSPIVITRSVDFSISVGGMIGSIRNRAYNENLLVTLKRIGKDQISISVVGEWR